MCSHYKFLGVCIDNPFPNVSFCIKWFISIMCELAEITDL